MLFAASILAPRHTVILDDGTATFRATIEPLDFSMRSLLKRVYCGFRWRSFGRIRTQVVARTIFASALPRLQSCTLPVQVSLDDFRCGYLGLSDGVPIHPRTVVFLGQPLTEVGLVSNSSGLDVLCAQVGARLHERFEKVYYVAHRSEGEAEVEHRCRLIGALPLALPICVEYGLARQGWLPGAVASFCSTALITLERLAGEQMQFFAVRLPEELVGARAANLSKVYEGLFAEIPSLSWL